ncbi:hypothetical protein [Micromonospora inyonensis]|uniref:Uncharacterized protein n=1 Tax=Micromonospora inyonensis TaxID=47866 RepID=A0A1C6RD05_9ACTN|nr:hypothetical protein [Micromonospora inyonensis]SCL15033.1 hypothetical protein GA0074694_1023 [Micromonospora inyonensis]
MPEPDQPRIVITPGIDEDPDEISGDAVDERDVLGEYAPLADPAAHQYGNA